MALPDGYSAWEHIHDVFRRLHNQQVREEFNDVGDDSWERDPDINTPRSSLRVACTMEREDNQAITMMRLWLFYVLLRKASDFQVPIYGIPVPSYQEARKFKPQITLYFQEDYGDIEPGYAPVTAEVSFRLMDAATDTYTEAQATTLANKIKAELAAGGGYKWKKGRVQCTYTDPSRGYALRLLVYSKDEGRQVITKILSLQNHTPDWGKMNVSENEAAAASFPAIPPNDRIFGRQRRTARRRPVADVRFIHALLHIHGMPHPVVLVDRSRIFRQQLAS